ncbi:anti-sigma factor [Deinococcus cavernae]|uniref:Anti-sigma factor n=1 Tax=Deinococcus cavernae TaxID=2320857 RepID=A0A418VGJ9_9DEIO|nr:anti-sigma factor [Deinococcus cavernae]RJF75238.1 anti-sigma factor [Deinococcus cavernae]
MTPDREKIMDYILGNLSPEEETQMQSALERDPALYAEWQADQTALMALVDDLDLSAVSIPVGAEQRLLDRLHAQEGHGTEQVEEEQREKVQELPTTPPPRLPQQRKAVPFWVPALLAVAAVSLVTFWLRPAPDALNRYAGVPGALAQSVEVPGQPPAQLVRLPDGRVFIRMNEQVQAGRTYQFWEIRGSTPVSLGVFDRDYLSVAVPAGSKVAVSVEPPGGSPQPTTEPLFVQGL